MAASSETRRRDDIRESRRSYGVHGVRGKAAARESQKDARRALRTGRPGCMTFAYGLCAAEPPEGTMHVHTRPPKVSGAASTQQRVSGATDPNRAVRTGLKRKGKPCALVDHALIPSRRREAAFGFLSLACDTTRHRIDAVLGFGAECRTERARIRDTESSASMACLPIYGEAHATFWMV